MALSDEVRLLRRPFAVYGELGAAEEASPARGALEKAGLLLLTIGVFASLTSAGRLVAFHVASPFVFYAFVPLLQAASVALGLRLAAPDARAARAISLYFSGHAPWKLFLLALALVPFVTTDTYVSFVALIRSGVVPALMLATIAWSGVLTYACFRAGMQLSRGRAALATAVHYAVFVGVIVGYYLASNQIQPQFPGIP